MTFGSHEGSRVGEVGDVALSVLLVEDSEEDELLLLRELRRGGYRVSCRRVFTARSMREALASEEWDIVISDHSMPAFDSSAALHILREKGYLDIPFIIVSGKIGEEAAVAAMRLGAHDYVMKDNLARLNAVIERELREAENRRERRRAREELRRSEERYRTFVARSTEGIWRAELEAPIDVRLPVEEQIDLLYERLYFAEANDAMARMYGYERGAEMVGLRLQDLMPREVPGTESFLRHSISVGYLLMDAESVEVDRRGDLKYMLNNFVGIVEEGHLVRVWGTKRDVTRSKEAERALRAAEEKYRSIFENAVEGIYQTSLEGTLLTANPAMARIFGYRDAGEMIEALRDGVGRSLYADAGERERFISEVLEAGEVTGYEVEMVKKDGTKVWVSLAGRARRDESGEVFGLEGTVEDISARRRAEEALRRSEAVYRSVVENAVESILIVDGGMERILEANQSVKRTLGYTEEDLAGMSLCDLVEEREGWPGEWLRRVRESGSLRLGEMLLRRKDGTLAEAEVSLSVIPYAEGEAICVISHDVSDRRRVERALGEIREAERRRISRDLHDGVLQDLTDVLSSMQLERRIYGGRREREAEQIEHLKSAVSGIRAAIYDLRLEGPEEQTLPRSLNSIIELNRQTKEDCEFVLSIADDFPKGLWGPASMEVVRVVQEALANVRRHSGASRAEVALKVERGERGEEVAVYISDNGIGFENTNVAGIGLHSMRERAEFLGARLDVESEVDRGTTVSLRVGLDVLRGR